MLVDLERAYFVDPAARWHDAAGSRRFISKKRAEGRVRILSPAEAESAGVEYGTAWTAELAEGAAARVAEVATAGMDEDDLPPAPEPAELDEDGPRELETPTPEPSPDPSSPLPSAAPDASEPRGPEEMPPPPPPPPMDDDGPPPPAVDTSVFAMLLGDVATAAYGSLLVRVATPKGHKPNPLADHERTQLRTALVACLDRYLPDVPTAHPELWSLAMVSAVVVATHRMAPHEPLETDAADGGTERPAAPDAEPSPPAPSWAAGTMAAWGAG